MESSGVCPPHPGLYSVLGSLFKTQKLQVFSHAESLGMLGDADSGLGGESGMWTLMNILSGDTDMIFVSWEVMHPAQMTSVAVLMWHVDTH